MLTVKEYRTALENRDVQLTPIWVMMKGDTLMNLHGFRAHEFQTGKYLGLVIVQQMLDPEGEPDGIVTFTETQGNSVDADALAILEMGK